MMSNLGLCHVSHGNSSSHRSVNAFLTEMRKQRFFRNLPTLQQLHLVNHAPVGTEYLKPQRSCSMLFPPHNNCYVKNCVMFLQLWKKTKPNHQQRWRLCLRFLRFWGWWKKGTANFWPSAELVNTSRNKGKLPFSPHIYTDILSVSVQHVVLQAFF